MQEEKDLAGMPLNGSGDLAVNGPGIFSQISDNSSSAAYSYKSMLYTGRTGDTSDKLSIGELEEFLKQLLKSGMPKSYPTAPGGYTYPLYHYPFGGKETFTIQDFPKSDNEVKKDSFGPGNLMSLFELISFYSSRGYGDFPTLRPCRFPCFGLVDDFEQEFEYFVDTLSKENSFSGKIYFSLLFTPDKKIADRVIVGNYSWEIMYSLVMSYVHEGLTGVQKSLISSDLFFRTTSIVSTNSEVDSMGYTQAGRLIFDSFKAYDAIKQERVDKMFDRLNEWSNGKVDEALDKTSSVLKGLISDDDEEV